MPTVGQRAHDDWRVERSDAGGVDGSQLDVVEGPRTKTVDRRVQFQWTRRQLRTSRVRRRLRCRDARTDTDDEARQATVRSRRDVL